jgi:hypothetical protein
MPAGRNDRNTGGHRAMKESEAWAAEADLWAAYVRTPDDPAVVRGLVAALTARGAAISPDLEERAIVAQRRELPEDPGLVTAHIAVLQKQGKPVPPALEELSLKQILAADPDNTRAVVALVGLYLRTGQPVPPELERTSLVIALAERPGDPGLLRAMAAVEAKLQSQPPAPGAAPAPAPSPQIVVRSVPTASPAPNPEAALHQALAARPADTFLLYLLLSSLLETGRITPQTEPADVLGRLPPQVQTSEAIVAALLQAAARHG